jgi:putative Mg2+ transporter-C (MgtC) family protein
MSYYKTGHGQCLEYRMVIRTRELENQRRLSETLSNLDKVVEFQIAPTGD